MAEEFQAAGICSSSSNWWSSTTCCTTVSSSSASRNGGLGSTAGGASSPCSTALTDINNMGGSSTFGWGTTTSTITDQNMANRSCDESAASISSVSNFQDSNHKVHDSVGGAAPNSSSSCVLMDSTLQMAGFGLASPTIDWTHALLRSSGRAESNFQAMLQEDLTSRPGQSYRQQDPQMESSHVQKSDWSPKTLSTASDDSINNITFKHINQAFAFDQQRVPSSSSGDCSTTPPSGNFYGCPSTMLQGLFDPEPQQSTPNYDNQAMNFPPPASSLQMSYRAMNANENIPAPWPKFPQFLKSSTSPPKQHSTNQLHFSNNTPYWNAAATAINDVRAPAGFYSSSPAHNAQFLAQSNFEEKPNCSNLTTKTISSEGVRDSCSATTKKSTSSAGSEPSFKRPRIETPSPLPTFKVRKEKLGDRITALQQLVSPFGKTDTASVLFEAIEYIKFLHEQVTVLSTPYMKNGASMQHQQNSDKSEGEAATKQDLRSRGLCLVPISSTFPVTNETTADFWTPTFGGTYR